MFSPGVLRYFCAVFTENSKKTHFSTCRSSLEISCSIQRRFGISPVWNWKKKLCDSLFTMNFTPFGIEILKVSNCFSEAKTNTFFPGSLRIPCKSWKECFEIGTDFVITSGFKAIFFPSMSANSVSAMT